jgi:hypothetical protein
MTVSINTNLRQSERILHKLLDERVVSLPNGYTYDDFPDGDIPCRNGYDFYSLLDCIAGVVGIFHSPVHDETACIEQCTVDKDGSIKNQSPEFHPFEIAGIRAIGIVFRENEHSSFDPNLCTGRSNGTRLRRGRHARHQRRIQL